MQLTSSVAAIVGLASLLHLPEFKEIRDNLKRKLKAGRIHPIPWLHQRPPKYNPSAPDPDTATSPRAAFCAGTTFVLINGTWVPCPEGDIIIDGGYTNPSAPDPINEHDLEGWERKWLLLHILVHEKWHDHLFNQALDHLHEITKGWDSLPEKQKQTMIKAMIKKTFNDEGHKPVFERQVDVLWLDWEMLRRQMKGLPEGNDKEDIKKKMKWIEDQVKDVEKHTAEEWP
jgi:hypothetical protein